MRDLKCMSIVQLNAGNVLLLLTRLNEGPELELKNPDFAYKPF